MDASGSADAYPLAWPEGWPRTPAANKVDGRYQFKKVGGDGWRKPYTFAQARDALLEELGRMRATALVISTNFQLNGSGLPRGDRRRPDDEGVAIYFRRGGKALAMACDRFSRAEENMNSLRLALEAMRQLERHGGGHMVEKAFTGFAALPAPKRWWEILELDPQTASAADVERAFRAKARSAHPDAGGSERAFASLMAARGAAQAELARKLPFVK